MREIKFRVWSPKYKEFFYFEIGQAFSWKQNEQPDQYTGLKDRNGKEIYEGDVVKHVPFDYDRRTESVVEYHDEGLYPFFDSADNAPYPEPIESEVIGNIYENPEFLEPVK